MKTKHSNLDERQEQALLKIESNGCWFAFFGLLVAILVQQVALGADFSQIAGEWIVFFALALYIGVACLREGIWDRHLRPDPKTNAIMSCLVALVVGTLMFSRVFANHPDKIGGSIAAGVFAAMLSGGICFATLSVGAAAYRKRLDQLESEPEDEE